MPFGRPGWKLRRGFGGMPSPISNEEVRKRVREVLSKAEKGTPWTGRCGITHIPIIVNGVTVGELLEDIDLNNVDIGAYAARRWGIKVQLVHNGQVVGFVWI